MAEPNKPGMNLLLGCSAQILQLQMTAHPESKILGPFYTKASILSLIIGHSILYTQMSQNRTAPTSRVLPYMNFSLKFLSNEAANAVPENFFCVLFVLFGFGMETSDAGLSPALVDQMNLTLNALKSKELTNVIARYRKSRSKERVFRIYHRVLYVFSVLIFGLAAYFVALRSWELALLTIFGGVFVFSRTLLAPKRELLWRRLLCPSLHFSTLEILEKLWREKEENIIPSLMSALSSEDEPRSLN